ncbi:MAG: hypothetical protein RL701_1569 [Pseudomonadota bacterium]
MRAWPTAFSWLTLFAFAWPAALPSVVQARREATFAYSYSQVWTAAVRLMRVDFEASIIEKDKEDGYFLFEYRDRGKVYNGSVELVAVKQGELDAVRVVLTVAALPTYVENMMVDRLVRKLDQEFGAPKQPKRPAAEPNPGDAPPENIGANGKAKPGAPKAKPDGD